MDEAMKSLPVILALAIVIAAMAASPLAIAQNSEVRATEQQVKESIEHVAKSVICFDRRLLDAAEIDREKCEYGISLFSDECWNILDQWVPDYGFSDTAEDKAKYERITDVYIICHESKFLKTWLLESGTDDPE